MIPELAYANRCIATTIDELNGWLQDGFASETDAQAIAGLLHELEALRERNRRAIRDQLWRERLRKAWEDL